MAHTAQHRDRTVAAWIVPRLRVQRRNVTTGHNTVVVGWGGGGGTEQAQANTWEDNIHSDIQLQCPQSFRPGQPPVTLPRPAPPPSSCGPSRISPSKTSHLRPSTIYPPKYSLPGLITNKLEFICPSSRFSRKVQLCPFSSLPKPALC